MNKFGFDLPFHGHRPKNLNKLTPDVVYILELYVWMEGSLNYYPNVPNISST